jgi:hypothetical protein
MLRYRLRGSVLSPEYPGVSLHCAYYTTTTCLAESVQSSVAQNTAAREAYFSSALQMYTLTSLTVSCICVIRFMISIF